jgi:hypothetical protein
LPIYQLRVSASLVYQDNAQKMFAPGFPGVVPDIVPELAYLSFSFAGSLPFVLSLVVGNDKLSIPMRRQ